MMGRPYNELFILFRLNSVSRLSIAVDIFFYYCFIGIAEAMSELNKTIITQVYFSS